MIIKSFNAKNGDAIHIISSDGNNIIVDMGYPETYKKYISKSIKEIEIKNENIDLLIITHIDYDHISGAISFFEDIHNGKYKKGILKQIWHNSYRHLSMSTRVNANNVDYNIVNTFLNRLSIYSSLNIGQEISALKGSTLAGLILKSGIGWNELHSYNPIIEGTETTIGDIAITALLPNEYILNKLKLHWRNELRKLKYNFEFAEDEIFDDAFEFYLLNEKEQDDGTLISTDVGDNFNKLLDIGNILESQSDTSVSNASSIVTIIESKNIRILLTGDALDCDLVEAITRQKENGLNINFDLVKLSHHGSKKNNYEWLKLVRSNYYLISTDTSKHNHPDIEAIVNIILSNRINKKTICFNNDLEIISKIDDKKLKEKYNYSIMRPNRCWGLEIEL